MFRRLPNKETSNVVEDKSRPGTKEKRGRHMSAIVQQIKHMFAYRIVGILMFLMGMYGTAGAITTNVFDNFDSYSVGTLGLPWTAVDVVVTNSISASSPNSAFFGLGSSQASIDFAPQTERWFQGDIYVVAGAVSGTDYIKFIDSGNALAPFQVLLNLQGNGTYNLDVLSGPTLNTQITYTNLTPGVFNTIRFGASITNGVTHDGWYSLYVNGNPLALEVPFLANFGGATKMDRFQLVNSGNQQIYLDNVSIIPEPSVFVLGAIGAMVLLRRRMRRS